MTPARIRTRVKICCIGSNEEARSAIRHGADAIGLVSEMPSGPGVIPESRIAEIAAAQSGRVDTVLLTSLRDPDEIIAQQKRCGTRSVQICDRLPAGAHARLRSALPDVTLWQVVHVSSEDSVNEAVDAAGMADVLLLDSGERKGATLRLGGTGRTHDWTLSRRIREAVDLPIFLAGGLRPENVAEAIAVVQPSGVDVCTRVRSSGQLDPRKLASFMAELRGTAPAG